MIILNFENVQLLARRILARSLLEVLIPEYIELKHLGVKQTFTQIAQQVHFLRALDNRNFRRAHLRRFSLLNRNIHVLCRLRSLRYIYF